MHTHPRVYSTYGQQTKQENEHPCYDTLKTKLQNTEGHANRNMDKGMSSPEFSHSDDKCRGFQLPRLDNGMAEGRSTAIGDDYRSQLHAALHKYASEKFDPIESSQNIGKRKQVLCTKRQSTGPERPNARAQRKCPRKSRTATSPRGEPGTPGK